MPSVEIEEDHPLSPATIATIKQRARAIALLNAAERAGTTPLKSRRLHAFSYLADVLSPVWNLQPFDGKILKVSGGPHYPDLQRELDRLVVLGIVNIADLKYISQKPAGFLIDGCYSLNFESPHLEPLLISLGARGEERALDPSDARFSDFLLALAGALSTVPDDQVDAAASVDATYADPRIDFSNVVDFGSWSTDLAADNLSFAVAERFRRFLPERAQLSSGEKLYLYASFLGRRVHGA